MISLNKALAAWGSPDFPGILKQEIRELDVDELPLEEGSYAVEGVDVTILNYDDDPDYIHAKAGIFYSGVEDVRSCEDDPTVTNAESKYCEVQVDIDKTNGNAMLSMIPESGEYADI